MTLEAIAALLGHRSLDMTLRYAKIANRTTFVVQQCAHRGVGSVTVLRSLLRFLLLDGAIPVDLSGAVPAVAGW